MLWLRGNGASVCRPDCGPPDAVLDAACVSSASGRGHPPHKALPTNRVRQGQLWWNLGPRSRPPSTVPTRARRLLEEWGAQITGHPTQAGPALPRRGPNGSRRQPIPHQIQPRGPHIGWRVGKSSEAGEMAAAPTTLLPAVSPRASSSTTDRSARCRAKTASSQAGSILTMPARIYFADDPSGHKVEVTVAAFAFESASPDPADQKSDRREIRECRREWSYPRSSSCELGHREVRTTAVVTRVKACWNARETGLLLSCSKRPVSI
jgi:hypothetical protein